MKMCSFTAYLMTITTKFSFNWSSGFRVFKIEPIISDNPLISSIFSYNISSVLIGWSWSTNTRHLLKSFMFVSSGQQHHTTVVYTLFLIRHACDNYYNLTCCTIICRCGQSSGLTVSSWGTLKGRVWSFRTIESCLTFPTLWSWGCGRTGVTSTVPSYKNITITHVV